MLSFKKGDAIGRIKGGKYNGMILRIDKEATHIPQIAEDKKEKGYKTTVCPHCDIKLSRSDNLDRHIRNSCQKMKKKTIADEVYEKIKKDLESKLLDDESDDSYDSNDSRDIKRKKKRTAKVVKIMPLHFESIHLDDGGTLTPLPDTHKRQVIYVAGPSDSGKSYYCTMYLKEFSKLMPDKDINLFSRVEADENLDTIKRLDRMVLDEDFLEQCPIDAKKKLNNSICIFDDIDTLTDKKVKQEVTSLRNDVIKAGRDQEGEGNDIYCLITNHQVTDFQNTRDCLNEATNLVMFPKSGSMYGITRCLQHYCGMNKKQIEKATHLNSRWINVYRRAPNYVMGEHDCYIVN
jgi:hypothetical protein